LTRFPTEICQLPSLRAFVLSTPYSAEEFPSEFAQLSNLRYLGLGELGWTQVPPVIWQLSNLRVLDLSENRLTHLSPEIGRLTQLRFLYLFGNRLLQLPAEIGQLTELEELGVWPHKLQMLPDEITQLRKLHELNLSKKLLGSADISRLASKMGMYIDPHPLFPALQRMAPRTQNTPPYPCACCGYLTRKEPEHAYEICPVCFWESDFQQRLSPSSSMGANTSCLIEARLNFARIGVSDDRFLTKVRPPLPAEIPDEERRKPSMNFGTAYA
jgi:Cysteine-rich CPCC/Leucine rich repeat